MEIPWHITPARLEEAAAVASLVNSAYRGDGSRAGWTTEADLLEGQRTDERAIAEQIVDPRRALLLARDGEGMARGCVLVERYSDDAAYIGMLTVDPRLQARGLGKLLLRAAEELASDRWGCPNAEMTVISVRAELIAWYRRRGYEITGEKRAFPAGDPRFGVPRVGGLEFEVLRKRLGSGR